MEREARENSILVRIALWIIKVIARLEKFVFNRSLYLSVMLTGIFIVLPMVGTFWLFALAHYLPPLLRAIVIWTPTILIITLAAAVDYLRSS